jgi:hypothetical protein
VSIPQPFIRVQNCVSVSGWQTQVLSEHICPAPHVPQFSVRITPQLSIAVSCPQVAEWREQNDRRSSGMQSHWLGETTPHVSEPSQAPQLTVRIAPQLSVSVTLPHS